MQQYISLATRYQAARQHLEGFDLKYLYSLSAMMSLHLIRDGVEYFCDLNKDIIMVEIFNRFEMIKSKERAIPPTLSCNIRDRIAESLVTEPNILPDLILSAGPLVKYKLGKMSVTMSSRAMQHSNHDLDSDYWKLAALKELCVAGSGSLRFSDAVLDRAMFYGFNTEGFSSPFTTYLGRQAGGQYCSLTTDLSSNEISFFDLDLTNERVFCFPPADNDLYEYIKDYLMSKSLPENSSVIVVAYDFKTSIGDLKYHPNFIAEAVIDRDLDFIKDNDFEYDAFYKGYIPKLITRRPTRGFSIHAYYLDSRQPPALDKAQLERIFTPNEW